MPITTKNWLMLPNALLLALSLCASTANGTHKKSR